VIAIGLTCAIYFACLVATGLLALPLRAVRTEGYADARRTLLAVQRAATAGFARCFRTLMVVVSVLVVLWSAANLCVTPNATFHAAAVQAGYFIVTGVLGALVSGLLAFMAIRWVRSASLRAVVAAHVASDRLLLTVLRSSLLVTLGVEALGFGICVSIFGIAWISQSATSTVPLLLSSTIRLLTSFTVGALLASYVLQTTGTTYQTAANVGSATAIQEGDLVETDPRNPSAIAETAGIQLGHLVPQLMDAFSSTLCANLLVALLYSLFLGSAPHPSSSQNHLLVPVVMRAFASLALVFAFGAARTLESVSPTAALMRSQAVATVISIGAVWGSCYWLLPEISVRIALCGTLGLVLPLAIGHWQNWILHRRLRPNSSTRSTHEDPWSAGLFLGMVMILGPLVALGILFGTALYVGSTLPIGNDRVLAIAVSLLAMNMAVPITTSLQAALPSVFLARRATFLLLRRRDDSGRRRLSRLDDAMRDGTAWATSAQTSYGTAIPLLASAILVNWAKDSHVRTFGAEILAATAASAIALLLPFAMRLRLSARASHALASEVRRQFNGAKREPGDARVPGNFTPSYRNCVDIAARESTRGLFVSAAVTSAPGLILGLALVWLTKNPGLVGQALALYLGQAAVAALAASFVLEVAIEFASASRLRTSRLSTLPDTLGNCAIQYLAVSNSPAARLLAKTSVIAVITFVPYLF